MVFAANFLRLLVNLAKSSLNLEIPKSTQTTHEVFDHIYNIWFLQYPETQALSLEKDKRRWI